MKYYKRLLENMTEMTVINTHSHFREIPNGSPFGLDELFAQSYVGWLSVPMNGSREGRRAFLDRVRYNSYYVWLEKALMSVYPLGGPVTEDNWDQLSAMLTESHAMEGYNVSFLRDLCGYEKIVHDPHWDPQQAIRYPGLFTPAYRINMFLYGYCKGAADHGGHNAQAVLGIDTRDIDEYVHEMRRAVLARKADGCVALKSALAYDRALDFRDVPKDRARKALLSGKDATESEIREFQDYIFFRLCEIAAESSMPFQNHTGLGKLNRTNAMQLHEAISRNPDTKFVLFHCGYPWMDDICALLHNYQNVYPDLCWLPILSSAAAERMIPELIDVGTSDKVCWGCDTWTVQESLGALMALRHVLAKALSVRVEEGYFTPGDAEALAHKILYGNAKSLYKL